MNTLMENNTISEVDCGNNPAYVVNHNTLFSATEYKVLQSQPDGAFIKCMKTLYNGKIQLYYLTGHYKALTDVLHTLDSNAFITVASNVLANILSINNNGFLSCQNVDIALEHIYVDPITYKVGLVYLPLSKRLYPDAIAFENELRSRLIQLIQNVQSIASPKTMQLAMDLSNGKLSLQSIYSRMKLTVVSRSETFVAPVIPAPTRKRIMRLVAANASLPFEIVVDKDEFTVGKKQGFVDAVIPNNQMVSRTHCKIIRSGDQFVVVDLASANGTYLNQVRLQPGQTHPVRDGDMICLANCKFQVSIE